MRLHLPHMLVVALMAAVSSAPAFASGYLVGPPTTDASLSSDVVCTPDQPLQLPEGAYYEGILHLSSSDKNNPISVTFKDLEDSAFRDMSDLSFDTFRHLEFTNVASKALDYVEMLGISGVTDGKAGTADVLFSGNTEGAILAAGIADNSVSMNNNGDIVFTGNTIIPENPNHSASGAAISCNSLEMNNNASITFSDNVASSGYHSYGGAINSKNVTMTGNGTVTFSGNSAEIGAAIDSQNGSVVISNNGDVSFSKHTVGDNFVVRAFKSNIEMNGNESLSFSENGVGGCIDNTEAKTELNNNGSVSFTNNTDVLIDTSGTFSMSGNEVVTVEGNTGTSTISNSGDSSLNDNGSVTFRGNKAENGFNMDFGNGNVTLNNNGSVSFSKNEAAAGLMRTYRGSLTMSGNEALSFTENTVNNGSVIGISDAPLAISNNGTVEFIGNKSIDVISGNSIALNNNESLTFKDNSSSGNVIDARYGSTLSLNGNKTLTISGNVCTNSYGAAIQGDDSAISLNDNGTVSICGNSSGGSYGGAIYNDAVSLNIRNNDSVEFAGNVEKSGSSYRLRSIYMNSGNASVVSLSAAEGKSITFRDSVHIESLSTVELNADYTNAEGQTLAQKGDILFTGATTEADLLAVKGSTGTAEEILKSRTTEVKAMTNLYGGRLRVEDGAVYEGRGITAHEDSEATVRVKDATLNHKGYSLSFASGTKLEVEGSSTISGNVVLKDGAAMSVSGTAALDGGLSLKSGATAASLEGVSLLSGQVSGNGESARMQDVWMEAVGEAYGFSGVAMENVHFSAELATLTLTDVSFDTDSSFSVGAKGSILLSGAALRITLPEAGNGGVYHVDLSHMFQCTVKGDLNFDLDVDALVADGYTTVKFDFGSDADEDYSGLSLNMEGATYEGMEGNVASFALPTIPEPTTATLSLLALAALASRRRRS